MQRLIVVLQLALVLLLLFGCAPHKRIIGKKVPADHYVCSTRLFPAKGHQKMEHFEFDYMLQRLEGDEYRLSGTVREVRPKLAGFDWEIDITIVFALIRGDVVVDALAVKPGGLAARMTFDRKFTSKAPFDGILVVAYYGKAYG